MPSLTDKDVHGIALIICGVRERLRLLDQLSSGELGLDAIERELFEAECALGRSLPPVNGTIILKG